VSIPPDPLASLTLSLKPTNLGGWALGKSLLVQLNRKKNVSLLNISKKGIHTYCYSYCYTDHFKRRL
jgi:hypothetical protein